MDRFRGSIQERKTNDHRSGLLCWESLLRSVVWGGTVSHSMLFTRLYSYQSYTYIVVDTFGVLA